jgi:hypothetical protein
VGLKFGDFVVNKICSTAEIKAAHVTWGKTWEFIVLVIVGLIFLNTNSKFEEIPP